MAKEAELLRWGIVQRARALQKQVEAERAEVGSAGAGLAHALELFLAYTKTLISEVENEYKSQDPPKIKLYTLRGLRQHLNARADLFDERFARGHRGVDPAITSLIEGECARFGIRGTEVLITIGPPENFGSFVRDLRHHLFKDLNLASNLPDHLAELNLLSIAVPRTEGMAASWVPITVGHELAHYLESRNSISSEFDLASRLDADILESFQDVPPEVKQAPTQARFFEARAQLWLVELICDAYAVHRFGAAGASALIEFLQSVGGNKRDLGNTHPPMNVRARLMREWLGDPGEYSVVERELLEHYDWTWLEPDPSTWYGYLSNAVISLGPAIASRVARWSKAPSYASLKRDEEVVRIYQDLDQGVPTLASDIGTSTDALLYASDVINACWLAAARFSDKPTERLTLKSLDTIDFLAKWTQAQHEVEGKKARVPILPPAAPLPDGIAVPQGTLSADELHRRLATRDGSGIKVIPLLSGKTKGASIDIRLGNSFLVFEQSSAAAFDALDAGQYPRSMQRAVSKSWGDVFHLHPRQLVLAATLEYIVLPGDVSAHVVTRSSYGRLGLISATAIQVHPNYAGCLTLELVNLGEMPLTITPGERVAQLVFSTTTEWISPEHEEQEKYRYPTTPEFSKITLDNESKILRRMREHRDTLKPQPPGTEQFEHELL